MPDNDAQTKILAQALYDIRVLLSGYLGSQNPSDVVVRQAAHLAYALHNEVLAILDGGTFDSQQAISQVEAVDRLFEQEFFATRFTQHLPVKA